MRGGKGLAAGFRFGAVGSRGSRVLLGSRGSLLGGSFVTVGVVRLSTKAAVATWSASVGRRSSIVTDTGGTRAGIEVVERRFRGAETNTSLWLVAYRGIGFSFVGIGFGTVRWLLFPPVRILFGSFATVPLGLVGALGLLLGSTLLLLGVACCLLRSSAITVTITTSAIIITWWWWVSSRRSPVVVVVVVVWSVVVVVVWRLRVR